jgi:predicted nucleic acid-binding protein
MRVMLDTNAYTALLAGDGRVADELARSEAILVPAIVVGELFDGFRGGTRNQENRLMLERFRNKPRTVLVPVTDATADWFALIKQMLRRKGRPIPVNDIWIAAACMEHGARLISFDSHFADIDGLMRWEPPSA